MKTNLKTVMLALFLTSVQNAYAFELAIVVSKESPIESLTSSELKKIFRLEQTSAQGGFRVFPVMQKSGGPERELMLSHIFEMTNEELKKYWLGKIFRGEVSGFPQSLGSSESVRVFVSESVNAIGYVDASLKLKNAKLRTVKIDGKLPGEKYYPLSDVEN